MDTNCREESGVLATLNNSGLNHKRLIVHKVTIKDDLMGQLTNSSFMNLQYEHMTAIRTSLLSVVHCCCSHVKPVMKPAVAAKPCMITFRLLDSE